MTVRPIRDWVVVADFGQSPTTKSVSSGGLYLPDGGDDSSRYNFFHFRMGEVLSVGKGAVYKGKLIVPTSPRVGEVILYSRRVGARLHYQHVHQKYGALYLRVLDQNQILAVMEDFEPWWNPGDAQISPSLDYSN